MPLILTVRAAADRPGAPPPLRLDRRGAVIGRAPGLDWTLPDERNTVSSRHCEIAWREGAYLIADSSTNGTYVNGSRLAAPQRLNEGDVIGIGPYEIVATLAADTPGQPQRTSAQPMAVAPAPAGGTAAEHLLLAAGLRRVDIPGVDAEILTAAGSLLRRLTIGARALLEARARARAQMGVTGGGAAGPLDQPGAPEEVLAKLLAPAAAGAAPAESTVGEAFAAIESHQLAILKAMQAAMKATLDRFSPIAIRARAGGKADDAKLWQTYEQAFGGDAKTRDDAFIEVFARELRGAYEALAKR